MLTSPLALIAEITHRCPLHCVYCSNPLQLAEPEAELTTDDWARVFSEASRMGVLHLHLTGGEPLARTDLEQLITAGHEVRLYTNLITSGIGLSRDGLARLVHAGLDHIQLSFQDSTAESADWIAGTRSHAHKMELAGWIREHRMAFTANLVVHRQNLDHLEAMIRFLQGLRPNRIEIAHVQYYGWALQNRASLMPTARQLQNSLRTIGSSETDLKGQIRIDSVVPDYHAQFPKACMGGWGRRLMVINPKGDALPCHAAGVIPGLAFDNVRERSLASIWNESAAFQKFRGESWMQEPCRSCERRTEDYGGCRCQAFLLTGDAAATDPVCSLATRHDVVADAVRNAPSNLISLSNSGEQWTYRSNRGRRSIPHR
ncbi:MAG TPA: pyrroloquinoline quinone biosynthesis protein PqqE [Terriglobales bacterium]|nr:pyrroloquinoline quinone biosynthesis protein PqqE [Terriglobales bacterium]